MNKQTIGETDSQHESTYGLLVRSEEKSRNLFEMIIYPVLIVSALIAIGPFVLQALALPLAEIKAGEHVTNVTEHSLGS